MAQMEATQLIQDVDLLLEKDAEAPQTRNRLHTLRDELRHVQETGEWPRDSRDPWRRRVEANGH